MKKVLLLLLTLTLLSVQGVHPAGAQTQSQPTMVVDYTVQLSQHYSILARLTHHISVVVHVSTTPHSAPANATFVFTFSYLGVSLPAGSTESVSVISQHPLVNRVVVTIPAQLDIFTMTLRGDTSDYGLLYRNAATLPVVSVSLDVAPYSPTAYNLLIPAQAGLQFVSVVPLSPLPGGVSPGLNQTIPVETIQIGGKSYLTTSFPQPFTRIVVEYKPVLRDLSLILYAAVLVAAVFAVPFAYRRVRSKVTALASRAWKGTLAALNWFTGRRLLGIFVASLALMAGLALVFGPAPTPRLYLAATPATAGVLGPQLQSAGYQYFTPLDAGDQFNVMSSLGIYTAVVIVDYALPLNSLGLYTASPIYVVGNQLSPG